MRENGSHRPLAPRSVGLGGLWAARMRGTPTGCRRRAACGRALSRMPAPGHRAGVRCWRRAVQAAGHALRLLQLSACTAETKVNQIKKKTPPNYLFFDLHRVGQ